MTDDIHNFTIFRGIVRLDGIHIPQARDICVNRKTIEFSTEDLSEISLGLVFRDQDGGEWELHMESNNPVGKQFSIDAKVVHVRSKLHLGYFDPPVSDGAPDRALWSHIRHEFAVVGMSFTWSNKREDER